MTDPHTSANQNAAPAHQGRSRKRARVISGMTDEQLQHKRNVDRKAQRAFRQRTKDSIERLQQRIEVITQTAAESEARFQHELAVVCESSHTLRQCLENISELASAAVLSTAVNSDEGRSAITGARSTTSETDPRLLDNSPHDNNAPTTCPLRNIAQAPSHLVTPVASENESSTAVDAAAVTINIPATANSCVDASPAQIPMATLSPSPHSPSSTPPDVSHNHQSLSPSFQDPVDEPIAPVYAQEELAHYPISQPPSMDLCGSIDMSPHICNASPSISALSNTRPSLVHEVLPSHVAPTCPLDDILRNFLLSRRELLAKGFDIDSAAGPLRPTVKAVLHPHTTNDVHPLCGIMSEVLSTFAHVRQPEKLAFYHIMYKTMRWQIAPSKESYMDMPTWLRPTVTQITVQHAAWIDNIPWPGVRDILIEKPDDHPFDVFSEYYSHNVSVNWPHDPLDAVADVANGAILHSIFEKHVSNLKNWTVTAAFQTRFPYMSSAIYSRD